MSGRRLRIVPYNGNKAYKYYLDGHKVNGKRKRVSFKDEAAANRKLAELANQQKKEGQDGLDIPLELIDGVTAAPVMAFSMLSNFRLACNQRLLFLSFHPVAKIQIGDQARTDFGG